MDYRIVEREAFAVTAKIEGLTADEIAEKVLPFWSIDGEMSPMFKNLLYVKREIDEESILTTRTMYIGRGASDGEVPDGYEVWQVPEYTWAVFKCVGAEPQASEEMWKRIYSEWLPQAKYEILPPISTSIIRPKGDESSPEYVCEIWLPVKKK